MHVKVPITKAGTKAASNLISSGISVTFTACYEAPQVLIAAALGATYIAPYMGRINDLGKNGHNEIVNMRKILNGIGSNCKLLVASLRTKDELVKLASSGISTFTINPNLASNLFNVKATIESAKKFEEDSSIDLDS